MKPKQLQAQVIQLERRMLYLYM